MVVSLITEKPAAATEPKFTADAPVKALPVMVTRIPPAELPLVGLTPVTLGAAAAE
jgi:hypothetical protein